ncbi:MAG: queuosine precursor transporter [Alphaproteobacteria bacterium]|nr:queuosine precursor transporter [Alphaproteobacteria bacterium]
MRHRYDITMDTALKSLIQTHLHTISPEILSIVLFCVAAFFLLLFLRVGGAAGLFCFVNLAYVAANIQVLHVAQFSFLSEPVALGTVLFAMTYLATDMLTEHYGAETARKSVVLSFLAQIVFTLVMFMTLAHIPLDNQQGNYKIYSAMEELFLPAPRIMVASIIAYGISQFLDIWLFKRLSDATSKKHIWLRTSASTLLSALADNVIFSSLAWIILSPTPVSFSTLVFTYILGTYIARAFVSVAGVPVMYMSYVFKPKDGI